MDISQIKKIEHFCVMPWFGLTISSDGGVRPCCEHKRIYNIHHDPPPLDFYNQREFISLRKDFLNGKKPDGCERCWKHEEQNGFSQRMHFNKKLLQFVPNQFEFRERLKEPQWLQADISHSNICNLKCRMCGIWGSVRWLNDEKRLGQLSVNYGKEKRPDYLQLTQNDINDLKFLFPGLKKIRTIFFKGGEPFLDPNHIIFLEYLVKNNFSRNLFLRYTTNGTIINDQILKLLSCFKFVFIRISVEGLGNLYRYIRGGDYSFETDIVKNIKRFSRLDNIFVGFNAVIQAYNILGLADLYEYLNNLNIKGASVDGAFNSIVHKPTYLSPFVLPGELRRLASKRLSGLKEFDKLRKSLVSNMSDSGDFELFKNFTNTLDKIREENVLNVIPEFKNFW